MAVIKNPGPEVSINRRPPTSPPPAGSRPPGASSGGGDGPDDPRNEAQRIIEDARAAAENVVFEAQRQYDQLLMQFRELGREQGTAQVGEELERAEMQAKEVARQVEPDIVALSVRVAEQMIAHDLEQSPELVLDIAANAIETLRNAKELTLRMHPKDAALARSRKAELIERVARSIDVSVKDDSDVALGGCVIQTEFGTIDAQLPTQLQLIRDALIPDGAKKEGPA